MEVAAIQKMSPSTTGRCSRQTADQWERGTATRQPITQICSPGVVKLVYLLSSLGRTREVLMGVGDGVASVIMLTFTKRPGPHADFYKEARPPC